VSANWCFVSKNYKKIYQLLRSRDLETARQLLARAALERSASYDYYKCSGKLESLRGNWAQAAKYYSQSIDAAQGESRCFLVYGDFIRTLLLAKEPERANQVLSQSIASMELYLKRPILSAQSIVQISKYAIRLGLFGVYLDLLFRKKCWNPWFHKLKRARQDAAGYQNVLEQWAKLQQQVGFTVDAYRESTDYFSEIVESCAVLLPMDFLSMLIRDFQGLSDYYVALIDELNRLGVTFTLKNQFVLNQCPEVSGALVFSWHTYGAHKGLLHIKEAPLPGFFYFDPLGYSGWAEIATLSRQAIDARLELVDAEEARNYFNDLQQRFVGARRSKYPQAEANCEFPAQFVFVAMQLLDDEVAKLADWDSIKMAGHVISLMEREGIDVVIKRHPKCKHYLVDQFIREISEKSSVHLIDAPIHDLIERSQAVCTVNSGVGLEALLHKKPVFTASPTDYDYLTDDLRSINGAAEFFECIGCNDRSALKYERFLTYYCRDYLVEASRRECLSERMQQRTNLSSLKA